MDIPLDLFHWTYCVYFPPLDTLSSRFQSVGQRCWNDSVKGYALDGTRACIHTTPSILHSGLVLVYPEYPPECYANGTIGILGGEYL